LKAIFLIITLLATVLAGCLGGPSTVETPAWAQSILSKDWSVEYEVIDQDSSSFFQLKSTEDASAPAQANWDGFVATVQWGSITGLVGWSNEGPRWYEDSVNPGAVSFLTVDRQFVSLIQIPWLPQMVSSGASGSTLPTWLDLEDANLGQNTFSWSGIAEEFEGRFQWSIDAKLDEHAWPLEIEVSSSCIEPPCVLRRVTSQKWIRTSVTGLAGPSDLESSNQSGGPILDSYPYHQGAIEMDPGGLAISLQAAIDASRSHIVVNKILASDDWYIQEAQFAGSNLTGDSTWQFELTSGVETVRMEVFASSRLHPELLWTIRELVPRDLVFAEPGREFMVPTLASMVALPVSCGSPSDVSVVGLYFQAEPWLEDGSGTGSMMVIRRGQLVSCADIKEISVAGITRGTLVLRWEGVGF
jgi:hypothetical protein